MGFTGVRNSLDWFKTCEIASNLNKLRETGRQRSHVRFTCPKCVVCI